MTSTKTRRFLCRRPRVAFGLGDVLRWLPTLALSLVLTITVALAQEDSSTSSRKVPVFDSIADADSAVPFAVKQPSSLPQGLKFQSSQDYSQQGKDILVLYYYGSDTKIYIELWQSLAGFGVGGAGDPTAVEVGGIARQLYQQSVDGHPEMTLVYVDWQQDDLHLEAKSTLTETWTLDQFLQVLASIS